MRCRLGRNKLGSLAQRLATPFNWEDLVVGAALRAVLEDMTFEASQRAAFWEKPEAQRLFPQGRGLLAMFCGPPGTGKTMAAQVIAAELGVDLYRIDLSAVVSKYVGETSQNLERVLARAARMDVILFFDEADALFGKRTEIKDAHDRFTNTDTGYLLQAIEGYSGIAVLATNKKGNVDLAFIRRIRYMIDFPKPDAAEREQIWQKIIVGLTSSLPHRLALDLKRLASLIELTGAQIKLAAHSAVLMARRERIPLAVSHLVRGIECELEKEGRAISRQERDKLTAKAM
jgi:SpoVK/Ycf46/Vps4 family AAA+-type ATPase